jgi:hypothetical protein
MAPQYKYTVDLIAQTKQFEQNMQKATSQANQLAGATGSVATGGNKLNSSLGMMGSGLGKLALMFGGPVAALSLLKGSIQAVEGPADKFEAVVSGGKTALFEFQRALMTLSFSDFLKNISEGYERGKKFAEIMDALAEEGAYTSYKGALLKVQSSELREMIRNTQLDIVTREKASSDRKKIEEDLHDKTIAFAGKERDAFIDNWEKTNKVKKEEAQKAYEISLTFSDAEIDALEQNEKYKRNKLDGFTRAQLDSLNAISQERKDAFAVIQKINAGEKDGIIKLYNAETRYNDITTEANNRLSLSIKENSMLIGKEEMAQAKLGETTVNTTKAIRELISITKIGTLPISLPSTSGLRPGPESVKIPDNEMEKMLHFLGSAENKANLLTNSIEGIGEAFGNLAAGSKSGLKEVVTAIISSTRMIIQAYLAEAIAATIARNAKLPWGLVGAIVGVTALQALWQSKIPEFAEGGLAYGPTIAQVGEYPGARSNPEVIAPLSKLERMLQPAITEGKVVFRIEGRELVGVLQREARVNMNIRGRG